MTVAPTIAMALALGVAATAAFCDRRQGEIPNWLTLPPLVLAPFVYGLAFGVEYAMHSLAAAFLSGLVPYLSFRRGAMGGGDVKAFGALGAITGFDLLVGLEIELAAFMAAMLFACGALAWRGTLLRTLGTALRQAFHPLLPAKSRREPSAALSAHVRMGGAIFVATATFATPYFVAAWSDS
jgi:prepilin peptidase CpaA